MTVKKKNPADLTLRNLHALKRRIVALELSLSHVGYAILRLERQVAAIQK